MPPVENIAKNTDQLSQIVERLKEANNVLVTVKKDPSVDQLAACIGLTIALNKEGKHATAVFSGDVPSTINFLEPEKTLEKDTNSLRDFIISLDKSKADKLRYKVEDSVVKIFITPYKTSISDADLEFSQGDFNVDTVVALGVHERNDLDATIIAHGRILHDATVVSVNVDEGGELGSINWADRSASSLSEMAYDIAIMLNKDSLDTQIATAFLTGIVAETDRFRNEKSSPHTMSVSGVLMAAGASTQLVASKLEEPVEPPQDIPAVVEGEGAQDHDGTIEIDHEPEDDIHIDDTGNLKQMAELIQESEDTKDSQPEVTQPQLSQVGSGMILEPPQLGGQLTANSVPEHEQYSDSTPDPLSSEAAQPGPTLSHNSSPYADIDTTSKTLSDLERAVNSPHITQPQIPEASVPQAADPLPQPALTVADPMVYTPTAVDPVTLTPPAPNPANAVPPPPEPDYAREAVERAVNAANDYRPEPLQNLGSTDLGLNLDNPSDYLTPAPASTEPTSPPPPPVPPPLPPAS